MAPPKKSLDALPFLPYGRQSLDEEDVQAVVEALRSDWLTQGPAVERFEEAVASVCGASHAVAVANGTAALHLACAVLDVGPDDWVWTSPNTFLASANCARYLGAKVDFVDVDARSFNMDVQALEAKLVRAKAQGRLPKVVIPVHFSGQPCDMPAIAALARRFGFKVIEDAAHALGASWRFDGASVAVGSGRWSDLTTFSFHPVKIATSGEGGMVLTEDEGLATRLRQLRSHAMVRKPEDVGEDQSGAWFYQAHELGWNYRITDIQCALGASQLRRLDGFVDRRRYLARRYKRMLNPAWMVLPWQREEAWSSWHLFVVRLRLDVIQGSRREVFDAMRAEGIGVHVMYIPVHTQPLYRQLGFDWGDFPQAEAYYRECLVLPLFPAMSDADQDRVVDCLHRILESA